MNAAGEDGYTPIHAALAQSNVPLARRLTACGASWDAVNAFACSVRDAARRSDDPAVRALLEQEELVSQLPGRIGHFRLESGHHSDSVDRSRAPLSASRVRPPARGGAGGAPGRHRVDAVCGPLVEGAFVALLVAADFGVEFYYTERFVPQSDGQGAALFPWSTALPPVLRARLRGKRVAIVNDVISAGSAVRGTLEDLQSCGAETVAVAALAVLGSSAAEFAALNNLALESLGSFPFTMWTPAECPLCQAGVALQNTACREALTRTHRLMRQAFLWCCALAIAAALLVATDYRSRDPDSSLYARLSGELAQQPASRWIAPEWRGAWNQEGLFREHPAGILLPSVLLIRAGIPAGQAAYIVNMLYQAAVIALIPLVAGVAREGLRGAIARVGPAAAPGVVRVPHSRKPGASAADVLPGARVCHAPRRARAPRGSL